MTNEKLASLLMLIVPQVIALIIEAEHCSEIDAMNEFYASKLYALLEKEETKMWHLSPLMLYSLYTQEKETGDFDIPEEA